MAEHDNDDDELPAPEGLTAEMIEPGLVLLSHPIVQAVIPEALTEAEQEIAALVFADASNEAIAKHRGVSPKTIGNQLDVLYRKLGVRSRVELVLLLRARKPRS